MHKRIDDPITDVYRHALMHGTATDFDNDVIASKAWCMLFAVGDWAEAKAKTQSEPDQSMTLAEGLCRLAELKRKGAEDHKKLDEWNDHAVDLLNPKDADGEFIRDCTDFFEAWVSKNYGRLSSFFPNYTNQTLGALAGEARRYYSPHPINGYIIEEADRPAPAIAQARIRISSDRGDWVISLRFVRLDGTSPVAEWEPGEWKLVEYTTAPFRDMGALSDE